ncbi:ferredoxin--NADP reductase [Alkalitalea saponilacus]|uniref:Ferredoxin--NADP+ reductase n=1 Tax=Alkalitalea saponilacus TaxID=889453 RepID=A0A1T5DJ17_9BACT|nr:FAD-binding oxidoreductase [Alkalitalea saponilacus]ASB50709.1 oxidoreductase [Alkalitalea saponilacus]SKB71695.1 ferredoxin--NADP+ reductase [Alkalitalea saponilacus]
MQKRSFNLHKITDKRDLTDSTFVLRMERNGLEFLPGQHIQVGPPNGIHTREYSIYNAPSDDYLEILVREVENGLVTPALKKLVAGDSVVINDAVGYFTIEEAVKQKKTFLFVASGTGISPFHSFVKSYPGLDYRLIHGIKFAEEAYEKEAYKPSRYAACTSQDEGGDFHGRVTGWLEQNPVNSDTLCYLCGNCDMIYDVYDILEKQGVKSSDIFTEVYF